MAYQGYSFIWDGTPSSLFGLKICSWDSSPVDYSGGSEMELIEDQAPHSLKKYLLGAFPNKPLEFEMAVYSEEPIADYKAQVIKKWLFGYPSKYRKLFIIKEGIKDVFYECYLNAPQDKIINGNNGWTFTVHCNAGGAWENERTARYTPANGATITFNNVSGSNDYMYPFERFCLLHKKEVKHYDKSNRSRQPEGRHGQNNHCHDFKHYYACNGQNTIFEKVVKMYRAADYCHHIYIKQYTIPIRYQT